MRFALAILISLLSTGNTCAQERFFTFVDGWMGLYVDERGGEYNIVVNDALSGGRSFIQTTKLSEIGDSITVFNFQLDSIHSFNYRIVGGMSAQEGYYVCAGTALDSSGLLHGLLVRFNEELSDTLGVDLFVTDANNILFTAYASDDSTIIIGSSTQSQSGSIYGQILKKDWSGEILWERNFNCGSGCNLEPNHILPLSDGGYLFTCQEWYMTCFSDVENIQTTLIRTDSQGNEIWRVWPGADETHHRRGPWSVELDDGNLLFAWSDIYTNECHPQFNDTGTVRFAKLAIESGEILWEKSLFDLLPNGTTNENGWGYGYRVFQLEKISDGNIVLCGSMGPETMLIKVDQEAQPIWYRFQGPPDAPWEDNTASVKYMRAHGFTETSDGGFIMAGEYNSSPGNFFPNGIQSAFALKVDAYGCLEPGCHLGDSTGTSILEWVGQEDVKVYPNPASNVVVLDIRGQVSDARELKVVDMLGREIHRCALNDVSLEVDIRDWPSGIYFLNLQFEDGSVVSKKLVKE